MPHIKACLHGLCAHNLRLSRETKSNVDVGRKSNEKKIRYELVDKFSQL